jgi:hypothetical protein
MRADPASGTLDALFGGPPPALDAVPRAGSSRLSADEVRKRAASAMIPPPRRRLLEGLALLWHDHLDAAHAVAQGHEGQPDHDLLHAMLHRREGDYPNAEYWFRSAGRHPSHAVLEREASSLLASGDPLRDRLLPSGRWSSKAFVAETRAAAREKPAASSLLERLQALEFRAFAGWLLGD